jgi:uncharacterized protein YegJ (DUF2314 family)
MIWVVVGLALIVLAALLFWWIRRRRRSRLISFVALLREPVNFDPAVLAKVAGKAWNADLGDGESEGADGFVVTADPPGAPAGVMNTIMHEGRLFLIISSPQPYAEDVEKESEKIADMRIRTLFCQHQAWFSCDATGVDGTVGKEDVLEWYRHLGKLFVELLDDNCLLIYLPDSQLAYPINEDTEMALRSQDPLAALQETLTLPIIEVSSNDPLMKQAVEEARQGWPRFLAAYEAKAGENFAVKAPVTHGDNTEFIWITVTSVEGDRVYGELGNDPGNLGPLKFGSKVSVSVADLNDWCYLDRQGKMVGGFTIEAVGQALRRGRRQ